MMTARRRRRRRRAKLKRAGLAVSDGIA